MANQSYVGVVVQVIGDGVSTTCTIVLDNTVYYRNQTVVNFRPAPDSVSSPIIESVFGGIAPTTATATLTNNGKQVLVTLSSAITGNFVLKFNLGYNI